MSKLKPPPQSLMATIEALRAAMPQELKDKLKAVYPTGFIEPWIYVSNYSGFCPLQAEGHLVTDDDGNKPFYFRARHEQWSFEVAHEGFDPCGEAHWSFEEDHPEAGWMEPEDVIKCIVKAAHFYLFRDLEDVND